MIVRKAWVRWFYSSSQHTTCMLIALAARLSLWELIASFSTSHHLQTICFGTICVTFHLSLKCSKFRCSSKGATTAIDLELHLSVLGMRNVMSQPSVIRIWKYLSSAFHTCICGTASLQIGRLISWSKWLYSWKSICIQWGLPRLQKKPSATSE